MPATRTAAAHRRPSRMRMMVPLLVATLIAASLQVVGVAPRAAADEPVPSGGGAGTAEDPYRIATLADLEWVRDQTNGGSDWSVGKYFLQTADIDMNPGGRVRGQTRILGSRSERALRTSPPLPPRASKAPTTARTTPSATSSSMEI